MCLSPDPSHSRTFLQTPSPNPTRDQNPNYTRLGPYLLHFPRHVPGLYASSRRLCFSVRRFLLSRFLLNRFLLRGLLLSSLLLSRLFDTKKLELKIRNRVIASRDVGSPFSKRIVRGSERSGGQAGEGEPEERQQGRCSILGVRRI